MFRSRLVLCVLLLLIFPASALERPEITFKIFQFPPNMIPRIDGNDDDWAMVPDSYAIVGCEALVRWQHPSRGFVLPDTFIPLAEETGMISDIDTWVLDAACTQVASWRVSGLADLVLAVNIAGRDLGRGEVVDRVSAALLKTGFPRDHLEVEITESSAVAQTVEALNELRHLRSAG